MLRIRFVPIHPPYLTDFAILSGGASASRTPPARASRLLMLDKLSRKVLEAGLERGPHKSHIKKKNSVGYCVRRQYWSRLDILLCSRKATDMDFCTFSVTVKYSMTVLSHSSKWTGGGAPLQQMQAAGGESRAWLMLTQQCSAHCNGGRTLHTEIKVNMAEITLSS